MLAGDKFGGGEVSTLRGSCASDRSRVVEGFFQEKSLSA
jgi:hypothetical protein